jgi:hypothetical protein
MIILFVGGAFPLPHHHAIVLIVVKESAHKDASATHSTEGCL